MARNILITGMSGLIGSAARRRLEPRARLTALNRGDVPGVATVRADLSELEAIRSAFEEQDTVVHLAAKAGDHYSWEELCDTNVIGTRNVAARTRQARRLQARGVRELRRNGRRLGARGAVPGDGRGPLRRCAGGLDADPP